MSESTNAYSFLAKILMLGEIGVGKTCILRRYTETCFCCQGPSTIGLDFKMRTVQVNGEKIKLQIWDFNGAGSRFRTITQTYYKAAIGVFLCYAINNRESFEKIGFWIEEIKKYASEDVCIVLVGTKNDLTDERVVSIDEGRKLADSYRMKFFENSAKNSVNIDEVFMELAKDIAKVYGDKKDASEKVELGKINSEEKGRCF